MVKQELTFSVTLTVDPEVYANAYGLGLHEVMPDFASWAQPFVAEWLKHHAKEVANGVSVESVELAP